MYALYVNGVLYSVSRHPELVADDIAVLHQDKFESGIRLGSLTVRFLTEDEADELETDDWMFGHRGECFPATAISHAIAA